MENSNLSENDYISLVKQLIEKKLNWEESAGWKQRDFVFLSDRIFEETSVLLSVSTLKRIWKTGFTGVPHTGTLNGLAVFAGYKNWNDFKGSIAEGQSWQSADTRKSQDTLPQDAKKRQSVVFYSGIVIIFIIISTLFYGYNHYFKLPKNTGSITFSSKKVVSAGVPNTVIFNYDISQINSDNVFLQQSWDVRRRDKLDRNRKYQSSIYYYPGFHKAKLIVEGEIIRQHKVHITTDGWLALGRKTLQDEIPVYINNEDPASSGRLYLSPQVFKKNNLPIDDNDYIVSYYNVRDFGPVSGDNFSLFAKIKNDPAEGGLTGQYSRVIVMCENTRMVMTFSIPGCVSNGYVKFSEKHFSGKQNDLSPFGCDLSQWNDVVCTIKDKKAEVFLDGNSIFTTQYENPAGRVVGLHFQFYGCGSVDEVALKNGDGTAVYSDNFK